MKKCHPRALAALFLCTGAPWSIGGCTNDQPALLRHGGEGPRPVTTFRNDAFRTGSYLAEHALDVAGVRAHGMRVRFENPVRGSMNAQPLFVPGVPIGGAPRDVVYAATVDNRVYAYDLDTPSATVPGAAELRWEVALADLEDAAARPLARGIYSTPAIDLARRRMYVVYSTKNVQRDHGRLTPEETSALDVAFWIVGLDLQDGSIRVSRRLTGEAIGPDRRKIAFDAKNHWCRPALLLDRGSLYVACGMRAYEGTTLYHGWVFRFDATTLASQGVFVTTPTVDMPGDGAGIWQSGSGPATDEDGNVYVITGNGPADIARGAYGDSLVKLSPVPGGLVAAGAFSPEGPGEPLRLNDVDFGAGGPLVLPGEGRVLGIGKTGILYLLDSGAMSQVQSFAAATNQYDPTAPVDATWDEGPHVHGTPTYWRGPDPSAAYLYVWGEKDYLKAYRYIYATRRFEETPVHKGDLLALPGTMPGGIHALSADGSRPGTGILWVTLPRFQDPDAYPEARFMAHDAETLERLWETTIPSLPKWMPPIIVDGNVIVGTSSDRFFVYELAR